MDPENFISSLFSNINGRGTRKDYLFIVEVLNIMEMLVMLF